jgi:allantoinase
VGEAELGPAMDVLRDAGVPLLVHAEVEGPITAAAEAIVGMSPFRYLTYLRSRPPSAEDQAIAMLVGLARARRARTHVVHCASASALELLAAARQESIPIGAETCPHYLHFAAEEVPDGATEFKCAPPIREAANREGLWGGISTGVIDMVVSDHSPCTPALKRGDFMSAWGGIASLQLTLPVMWTELRRRGIGLERLVEWMCRAPAGLVGLDRAKGAIGRGFDADLVVWDPDARFQVVGTALQHRSPLTPYDGEALFGAVRTTIVGGRVVYDGGRHADTPTGRLLLRA